MPLRVTYSEEIFSTVFMEFWTTANVVANIRKNTIRCFNGTFIRCILTGVSKYSFINRTYTQFYQWALIDHHDIQ